MSDKNYIRLFIWPALLILLGLLAGGYCLPRMFYAQASDKEISQMDSGTQPTRLIKIYDSDLPPPPIAGMTFHFLTQGPGEYGTGKIRIYYATLSWSIWFGVENGQIWVYHLPQRSSVPESLRFFYDSLGIDENTVRTNDGRYWFTGIPPWLDISKYAPDLVGIPVLASAASTDGQATIEYYIDPDSGLYGTISGHVCLDDGVTPLAGASIIITMAGTDFSEEINAATDGAYTFVGLLTGQYTIAARMSGYVREYFDDVYNDNECTPITLTAPAVITGVDFDMATSEPGDATEDGSINIADILFIEKIMLEIETEAPAAADADFDGRITMGDVILIERKMLGLDNT
jgi:hypothetical protein